MDDVLDPSSAEKNKQWNIFVSRGILFRSSGLLTGYVAHSDGILCVLGLLAKDQDQEDMESEGTVGYWHAEKHCNDAMHRRVHEMNFQNRSCRSFVHIYSESKDSVSCTFFCSGLEIDPPICILFQPEHILCSYILTLTNVCPPDNHVSHTNKGVNIISSVVGEKISHVMSLFLRERHQPSGQLLLFDKQTTSCISRLAQRIFCFFPCILMAFFSYFHPIFNSSFPVIKKALYVPKFSQHFMARCKRSHDVLCLDKQTSFHLFIKYNTISQHLCESLIGLGVLYYFVSNNLADVISSFVLDWADDVAKKSNELIMWLMGAPAGMKLNSQLTSMLGHFFIYHIYLWTGYLSILRTALPWLLHFASWAGVFGVSFQLCIIKDIISMLTLHIYCFYVFAARIFNLQLSGLASLWRLFRGKKWNALRCRVDSAQFDTDQLFVGTLLFTVLLFLLPTTALYYAVFTALRIVALSAQGVLTRLIECIDLTPVYSLLLYVLQPKWIAGAVEFDIIPPSNPPSCLVLNMKTSKLRLADLVLLTSPYLKEAVSSSYTWSELISHIFAGKILYPWINTTPHKKQAKAKKG